MSDTENNDADVDVEIPVSTTDENNDATDAMDANDTNGTIDAAAPPRKTAKRRKAAHKNKVLGVDEWLNPPLWDHTQHPPCTQPGFSFIPAESVIPAAIRTAGAIRKPRPIPNDGEWACIRKPIADVDRLRVVARLITAEKPPSQLRTSGIDVARDLFWWMRLDDLTIHMFYCLFNDDDTVSTSQFGVFAKDEVAALLHPLADTEACAHRDGNIRAADTDGAGWCPWMPTRSFKYGLGAAPAASSSSTNGATNGTAKSKPKAARAKKQRVDVSTHDDDNEEDVDEASVGPTNESRALDIDVDVSLLPAHDQTIRLMHQGNHLIAGAILDWKSRVVNGVKSLDPALKKAHLCAVRPRVRYMPQKRPATNMLNTIELGTINKNDAYLASHDISENLLPDTITNLQDDHDVTYSSAVFYSMAHPQPEPFIEHISASASYFRTETNASKEYIDALAKTSSKTGKRVFIWSKFWLLRSRC